MAARKSPAEHAQELKDLVVSYATQETVDPLKALGRYLGYGMAGGFFVGGGVGLLLLGMLRGLQQVHWLNSVTQAGGWHGSWVPYAITIISGVLVVVAAIVAAQRSTARRRETLQ